MKPEYALISLMLPAAGLLGQPAEFTDLYGDPFTPLAIAEALRTDGPITLDGLANEPVWDSAPSYTLDKVTWPVPSGLGWDDPISGTPVDPEDLSASFQAAWDDEYLYLLVKVTDDVIVVDSTGTEYENDDGVEIYLDGDNSRDKGTAWNVPGYDFINDRQLKIKADNTTPPVGGLYDPTESGTVVIPQDIVVERTFVETDIGYNIEIRMNFSGIFRDFEGAGGTVQDVVEGAYFGFDIKVTDDDDGGERDITYGWAADSNNNYADPAIFGTMVLVGGGVVEPPVSPWEDVAVIDGTGIKDTGIGYIVDVDFPWIYSFALGSYIHVYAGVSESKDSVYAQVMSIGQPVWLNDSIGWWYNLAEQQWGEF
jgi:hypothetical protein